MHKILLFLALFFTMPYGYGVPFSMHVDTILIKVKNSKYVIIRSSDQTKRWVMHDTCFVIQQRFGRLYINGKSLSIANIVIFAGDEHSIVANGIDFNGIVHVIAAENTLVCSGIVHNSPLNGYAIYYLGIMKQQVELCMNQLDAILTEQLIAATHMQQAKTNIVKVLLDSAVVHERNVTEWTLQSENIMQVHKHDHTDEPLKTQNISIVTGRNKILINGVLMKSSMVYIEPHEGYIEFKEKKYKGGFVIIKDNHKVLLINTIDLEEYIYAVVRSESWPGWPLEVNKVFAISCRSYALSLINKAQRAKKLYHIKDTNAHQRYNLYGEHQDATVRKAVESTKGICLTYQGKPILAMFDSCCGGIIPAHTKAFNFTQDTIYLARQYPCTFCKKTSLYSWQVVYDIAAFEKIIAQRAWHVVPLKRVRIHTADKAGVVNELLLEGHKKSIKLPAKWLSTFAKEIKSCFFSVEVKEKKVIFKGNGLGHLVGLCQWGAWQMVKEGWDYKSILRFYYPCTDLKKLF
ncbi:SpoIID/LytB domain-containing protein [Candidatus Dependentiae bacterium]|nr:MAG: SpoIID/LytB domain-containing protein [Candidatus Dependentiae bacterium]